jgi:hypothetical protein
LSYTPDVTGTPSPTSIIVDGVLNDHLPLADADDDLIM